MRKPILILVPVVALFAVVLYSARHARDGKVTDLPAASVPQPAASWQTRDAPEGNSLTDVREPVAATAATGDAEPEPVALEQDPAALAEMRAVMPDLQILSREEADAIPRAEDVVVGDGAQEEPIGYQLSEEEIRNYPMPTANVNPAGDAVAAEQAADGSKEQR